MPAGTSTATVRRRTTRPRPSQRVARRLGHAPVAAADVAGHLAHDLAEGRAADRLQQPRATAALARRDRRARLGAVAVAALAGVDRLEVQLDRRAARRLRELDVGADRDVRALGRAGARRGAEASAAEEGVEEVGDRAEALEVRPHAARAQALVAVAVVGRAALGVAEDLVGLGGLLELLLGPRIVRVDVGVQLARQLAEGLLDLGLVGVAGDAEDLVGVSGTGARHGQLGS